MIRTLLSTVLLAVVCVIYTASAQFPEQMSYQGVVQGITPPTGPVNLIFRLYQSDVAGQVAWVETHSGITLDENGIFSVILGITSPLSGLSFDTQYWMEIELDGSILTPRVPLTTSPYAFRARTADDVENGSIDPESLNSGGQIPTDGQLPSYDAENGRFEWINPGMAGPGISALQEGSGILVTDPNGPIVTVAVADNGIDADKIQSGAVTTDKIATDAVTTIKVADGSITQEKLADDVGLPSVGTAGGHLTGNYPNPSIADDVITEDMIKNNVVSSLKIVDDAINSDKLADGSVNTEHVNAAAELSITSLSTSQDVTVDQTLEVSGNTGIGTAPSAAAVRLTVQGSGATTASAAMDVQDNTGSSLLFVRDDGNVGVGTNTPTAAVEIAKPGGYGLIIGTGGMVMSSTAIAAANNIIIPAGSTIVEITPDGVRGTANATTLPASVPGQLLIIINNDNDSVGLTGTPIVIAPATSAILVVAPSSGWTQIN